MKDVSLVHSVNTVFFKKLLCDRTGTLGKITAGSDAGNAGTDDTGKVDTIVLVKTGIFECNKGMPQIDRYLIDCYILRFEPEATRVAISLP